MARKWQLQEAKNRLSELVDLAQEEPQTVTRHGKEVAVIISKAEFDRRRRARGPRGTILPFLRGLAFRGSGLELSRSADLERDVDL